MGYSSKKINLKNIFYSASPGLVSILLTFLSLPIYLKYLTPEYYSSFLISHIFMSLSLIFNFNIGKVASIKIQNKNIKLKSEIISNAIYLSLVIAIIFSSIIIFFLSFIFYKENQINFFLIFIGLVISILFINIESIAKGLGKFKIVALTNLLFYGFSISGPSFLILSNFYSFNSKKIDLFSVSIILKIISLLLIFLPITVYLFKNYTINKKIIFSFKNQSLWMTLSNMYNQIFDYLDKYLIKLFLNPIIFINYTVAQQIASKLSIFSNAITSVMLPKLASQKSNLNRNKVLNLHLFLFYIPFSIFITLFDIYFDDLLRWWLKESFNYNFYKLFNIFLVLTFIACQSHIIISLYEANEITKKNSIFESIIILPFIFLLFFLISKDSILLICFLILTKEILLFLIRIFYIRKNIIFFHLYLFSIFVFLISWIFKSYENYIIVLMLKFSFLLSVLALLYCVINKYKKIH